MRWLALFAAAPLFAGVTAEFQVRSISSGEQMFVSEDHIVVEVTVTPPKAREIPVAHSHFTLRMNGKKRLLLPQSPQFVAAAFKHPDWHRQTGLTAQAGPVILGGPQVSERFPGDPNPGRRRLPRPPGAPEGENRRGIEKEEVRPEELVVKAALPEAPTTLPVKGYLYFPYRGKIKKIKTLELIYTGPAGDASLRLR
jgi:hypothetical protein